MGLWPCPVTAPVSDPTGTEVYTEHARTRSHFFMRILTGHGEARFFIAYSKRPLEKEIMTKLRPGRRELQKRLYSTALRFTLTICTFANKPFDFSLSNGVYYAYLSWSDFIHAYLEVHETHKLFPVD